MKNARDRRRRAGWRRHATSRKCGAAKTNVAASARYAATAGELSAAREEWIAWARAKADWIDPLVQVRDVILDAPEPKRPGYW